MTTTASITRCLKSVRLDLIGLLACVWLLAGLAPPVHAQTAPAAITALTLERSGDEILLTANVRFELSAVLEEALQKGVPMIFVAQADIFRQRWYWTNKRVASAERQMRLAYQPLTRRWRLNVSTAEMASTGLGVALNQYFDSLPDALTAVQRLSRWKIADIAELDLDQKHQVEFRFQLDLSQLPRPFQIGMAGQTDWTIAASSSQALVLENSR